MLFVGTSIIHPSTEGVFLLCNILDLLIYSMVIKKVINNVLVAFFDIKKNTHNTKKVIFVYCSQTNL